MREENAECRLPSAEWRGGARPRRAARAMKPSQWWGGHSCPFLFVLVFIFILPMTAHAAAPASAPSDQPDAGTQELINAINTGKSPPPATAPADTEPDHPEEAPPKIEWGRLIVNFDYMLMTAAALGVAGSILGLFVLLRREALVALAIPQVVAVGAAIGMRLEWPTLPPALGLAIIALIYFALSRRWAASNWVIPSAYIAGLCLSFLIIANHGQDVEDLQHLFVGVDVAVSFEKAAVSVPILLVVAAACAMLWRRWLLLAQAPAAAELAGLKPARWDTLFLALLTTVILLGTYSLTVVMVLAMLFLPAASVLPWARRLPAAMLSSALLSVVFVAIGFYLSNTMNWPLSQSIGGTGFAALAVSHLLAQFK
jgi:ABC-type Mn2+/Zn2+ transport system permease subunit